jgi:ATP-dependent Clp protease protease subunit
MSSNPLPLPLLFKETNNGSVLLDMSTALFNARHIWISGPIDSHVGASIASQLMILDNSDNEEEITIWINSPGGSLHGGLFCIIDAMSACRAPIKTVCIGEAQSSGAYILSNGTPGLRFATKNSIIMIHDIQVTNFEVQSVTQLTQEADRLKFWNDRVVSLVAKNCGKSKAEAKEAVNKETSFSADEAKKFGLIDKVLLKF